MKVQVTESGTWRRTLEVEVAPEAVEEKFEAAYKNYGKSLNLPGFRKGKVPLRVVKARFGKAIQGEVLQEIINESYQEASKSQDLHPVSEAAIEDMNHAEGQPLRFKVSVDVKPELVVEHYKGLKVVRPTFKVGPEMEEGQLKALQDQNAVEQVVDRPADLGDVLLTDLQESDESGLPIVGRKQEDRAFQLGAQGADSHDVDNQLIGIKVGEERRVHFTQSEDGESRKIHFTVVAKEIRERILPELDDEFAKDLGDFDSLDALKTSIREDLEARSGYASKMRLEENIVDALVRENVFDVPESMVENYLNALIENYKKENEKIDEEAVRNEGRGAAVRSVKRHLLLEAIGRLEDIKVTEEDVDRHLESLSQRHNVEGPRLRQILGRSGQLDHIRSELLGGKTLDFLVESAEVNDVEESA